MEIEKDTGLLSKLFGSKKTCCCNMKIEEVAEDQTEFAEKKDQPKMESPCCDRPRREKS